MVIFQFAMWLFTRGYSSTNSCHFSVSWTSTAAFLGPFPWVMMMTTTIAVTCYQLLALSISVCIYIYVIYIEYHYISNVIIPHYFHISPSCYFSSLNQFIVHPRKFPISRAPNSLLSGAGAAAVTAARPLRRSCSGSHWDNLKSMANLASFTFSWWKKNYGNGILWQGRWKKISMVLICLNGR